MLCSSSSSKGGGRRDWAALQDDLLFCIAGKLTVFDYVTFRAVCRSWLAAVPDIPLQAPHAPYLLLGPACDRDRMELGLFTFLSLPDNTLHRFRIPELHGKYCAGSQYGWLATVDRRQGELALLNPFTGQHIPLPSLATLPGRSACGDCSTLKQCWATAVTTVALSSDPADGTAFTVAALLGCSMPRKLVFTTAAPATEAAAAAEERWNFYEPQLLEHLDFHDVAFDPHGRLLGIAMGVVGFLLIEIDFVVGFWVSRALHFDVNFYSDNLHVATYLLLAHDGGGVPLCVVRKHGVGSFDTTNFQIFKAESDRDGAQEYRKVTGLDGRAFFVGTGPSVLLSAGDVRRLKLEANRVYFTDVLRVLLKKGFRYCYGYPGDSGICNLEDKTISPLVGIGAKCSACGDKTTCRHDPWPIDWFPPVWITPSVRRRPTA